MTSSLAQSPENRAHHPTEGHWGQPGAKEKGAARNMYIGLGTLLLIIILLILIF
jgi:hypothetical protein